MGGLGNQMFMFAAGYGLTHAWGRDLTFSSQWYQGSQGDKDLMDFRRDFHLHRFPRIVELHDLDDYFPRVTNRLLHKRLSVINLLHRGPYIEQRPGFDSELARRPQRYLLGYFQSPQYFDQHLSSIQTLFTLSEIDEARLKERYRSLTTPGRRTVMVHVRRDDSLLPGNEWIGQLSTQYYERVMREWDIETTSFLVFSDSPDWCEGQPVFRQARIVHEADPVVTMRLMSLCDDFIIAGSTLSWWGAWLGRATDKRVIAPLPFFRRTSRDTWAGLIAPNWKLRAAHWSSA